MVLWFTGLSASGKTTLSQAVAKALRARGEAATVLDGDAMRQTLSRDLGFSRADRETNMRRLAALAQEHAAQDEIVLVAIISPFRELREQLRRESQASFLEIFVDAPLATCEERDPKGLYQRARSGELARFTGVSDPYEPPTAPDVHCFTAEERVDASAARILKAIENAAR